VLGLTRAWTLVRFFDGQLLKTEPCRQCGGRFVVHSLDLNINFVCGLCHVPSRAGKTKKARLAESAAVALEHAA
jgi:flagellar transcriptional activator FlhC